MIKNQNDFEIPEENITCENMPKNDFFTEEKKQEENLIDKDEEEEEIAKINNNNNNISDNYKTKQKEKEKDINTKTQEKKDQDTEIEMANLSEKYISSSDDDYESDLNVDDEGSIQPLNHRKLKDQ